MKQLARRITGTSKKSFGMYARAAASGRDDLIHMELGKPFADTPQHIKDATASFPSAKRLPPSSPGRTA